LAEETNYTWKVRAKKGNRESEWSATKNFQTSATPLIDRITGNWSANDAVINFRAGDSNLALDGLLFRDHTSGAPVTVAIAKNGSSSQITVTGMDHYIDGGIASTTAFNIDDQLVNLPLTVNNATGTVSATKSITSNNVYTKYAHVKIGDIPNYQELLGVSGTIAGLIKNYYINDVAMRVNSVTITGTLDGAGHATYSFVYDITVTKITHNVPSWMVSMAGYDSDNLHTLIPTPQYLLSDVECTK
jgi:hypothetical protein